MLELLVPRSLAWLKLEETIPTSTLPMMVTLIPTNLIRIVAEILGKSSEDNHESDDDEEEDEEDEEGSASDSTAEYEVPKPKLVAPKSPAKLASAPSSPLKPPPSSTPSSGPKKRKMTTVPMSDPNDAISAWPFTPNNRKFYLIIQKAPNATIDWNLSEDGTIISLTQTIDLNENTNIEIIANLAKLPKDFLCDAFPPKSKTFEFKSENPLSENIITEKEELLGYFVIIFPYRSASLTSKNNRTL